LSESRIRPLDGISVVDVSDHLSGQVCARYLADAGANVMTIAPIAGLRTERIGPFRHADGKSLLFETLTRSNTVTRFANPANAGIARAALSTADVVLVSSGVDDPPSMASAIDPDLQPSSQTIVCDFADFPTTGPYASWRGTEMLLQAMSGLMYMTGPAEGPPRYGIGHRAYQAAGITASSSIIAALIEKERSGVGQRVEVSVFEAANAMAQNLITQYSYSGTWPNRERYDGALSTIECSDGWMILFALPHNWEAICIAFDAPDLYQDSRYADSSSRLELWPEITSRLQTRARSLKRQRLVERCQGSGVCAEVVAAIRELRPSINRQAWATADRTSSHARTARSHAFDVVSAGYQHHADSHTEADARVINRPPSNLDASDIMPLAGIRIIDLTMAWAGPFATRGLAFLGADVIKIENPRRIDPWRSVAALDDWFPNGDRGERPYNRSALFNTQNHDKRSIAVDLTKPQGRSIVLDLVKQSHLLVANFPPGVLRRLGLDAVSLRTINPAIAVVEMPAYGRSSAKAAWVGMGKTMEAAAGMVGLMDPMPDGTPTMSGPAYLDPIGGLHGTAASLLAVFASLRQGVGLEIEVAQTDAASIWIDEYFSEQAENGAVEKFVGNSVAYAAPHDAYPCLGNDEWIAIAITNDAEWRRLVAVVDRQALRSPELEKQEQRVANAAMIDEALASWTSRRSKHELARELQKCGVPAAPIMTGRDLARDPGLKASGFHVELIHDEAGRHTYPGLAYRLSRTPGRIRTAAPLFGEATDHVLRNLLKYKDDDIRSLLDTGVVHLHPLAASPGVPRKTR
jgi:crotonobetainyl-CoA:carnitine CoA-transferase CaiB-like acyl-CoA transferase